jgi:hypothetical protein
MSAENALGIMQQLGASPWNGQPQAATTAG